MRFKVLRRPAATRDMWDSFVRSHPDGTFRHTWDWLDYQVSLLGQASGYDFSMLVLRDGKVSTLIAAILNPETRAVDMEGEPGPMPLTSSPDPAEDFGLMMWRWPERLPVRFQDRPRRAVTGTTKSEFKTRVLEVFGDPNVLLPSIWTGIRKSYQSCIHQSEARYDVKMARPADAASYVETYRSLNAEKGSTRPEVTYLNQREWVAKGAALLATAWDGDVPVGATYVMLHGNWAYYASGPSVRRNVQHLLQWRVIQELSAREDIRHYELGWQGRAPEDDTKGRNIEFFKRGFGGTDYTITTWEGRPGDVSSIFERR